MMMMINAQAQFVWILMTHQMIPQQIESLCIPDMKQNILAKAVS